MPDGGRRDPDIVLGNGLTFFSQRGLNAPVPIGRLHIRVENRDLLADVPNLAEIECSPRRLMSSGEEFADAYEAEKAAEVVAHLPAKARVAREQLDERVCVDQELTTRSHPPARSNHR